MKRKLLIAVITATLALGGASPAFAAGRSGDHRGAVTTHACVDGEFFVTVQLPDPPPMGGARLTVYEAKRPC